MKSAVTALTLIAPRSYGVRGQGSERASRWPAVRRHTGWDKAPSPEPCGQHNDTHTHTQLGDPGIVKAQRYNKAWRLKLHAHFQKRVYGHNDNAAERKTRFSQMSEFLPELKWNDLNSYHKPLQWLESTELWINCPIFEKENSVLS